ncbi:hypothetical protein phiCT453A_38 (endogenous virus) [Clostridium phage phiCT453A]|uniref:hypothetical protein n=1 Tax=Clostridium phage phiCT453A TaxID=1567012 RepID=UPI0005139D70|nr:hypothetical protein [Clostridium tetani]YP_009216682.1 hypothetical protein phiCT453A_38 [Clostridium phage phiCT453A]AJA42528.1 hypothetical protein phiCT453A_38 [Clostridium phage phiCT453A]KGI42508.1 hypothetical protein KY55_10535 [Clostridium tetani]RXM58103.1 hypothetical protein DP133_07910 [Clostridium tetani]
MKWFGIDFGIKDIFFETDEKQHIITFKIDLFGNIKDVGYAEGEKGTMGGGVKEIKIKSTSPNIFGRIRYLMEIIIRKIKKKLDANYF